MIFVLQEKTVFGEVFYLEGRFSQREFGYTAPVVNNFPDIYKFDCTSENTHLIVRLITTHLTLRRVRTHII